ncbi:uncharacterized protein B0H18DRAFT_1127212 [Fomitopsis serialis]|uniref:uncharacterized protein n=1 Tax=Fomitopsis serialis TaxID=139415 RepID=UPI002007EDA7|nr:uncharacterized protein B0H18DRAFT_1127212 [Neoantrodia serialis]KAH9912429.1 hypothetical protein B0H18DRAFT_1127212 [Neoantrodia serialis]
MPPMCSMKCNFIKVDWIWPVGLAKPREYLEAEWRVVRRAGEGKEVRWEKLIKLGSDAENPIVVV